MDPNKALLLAGALAVKAVAAYPLNRWLQAPFFQDAGFRMRRLSLRSLPRPKRGARSSRQMHMFFAVRIFLKVRSLYLRNLRLPPFKAEAGRCSYLYSGSIIKSVYPAYDGDVFYYISISRHDRGISPPVFETYCIAVCAFRVSAYTENRPIARKKSCEPSKFRKVRSFFVLSTAL